MPEGVDQPLAERARRFPVLPAEDFDAQRPAQALDGESPGQRRHPNLNPLPEREDARIFPKARGNVALRG